MLRSWQALRLDLSTRAPYEGGVIARTLQHDLRKSVSPRSDRIIWLRTDHTPHPDQLCQAA